MPPANPTNLLGSRNYSGNAASSQPGDAHAAGAEPRERQTFCVLPDPEKISVPGIIFAGKIFQKFSR
jgi:hypothetical protein